MTEHSKTQVLGPDQDSGLTVGPRSWGASPVRGAPIKGVGGMAQPLNRVPLAVSILFGCQTWVIHGIM